MQSSVIISAKKSRTLSFANICSFLTPVHRYRISQDGEIISRGDERFCFVCFCSKDDVRELFDKGAEIGRHIGYIRDGGTFRLRRALANNENYIILEGPAGDELFKQVK